MNLKRKKKDSEKMSIKTAVLLPLIMIMFIFIMIFMIKWQSDYRWIASKQSQRILSAISKNVHEKLYNIMESSLDLNRLYANQVLEHDYLDKTDYTELQNYTYTSLTAVKDSMPQVRRLSFGGENGNFVGYRTSETGEGYELLLMDIRTQSKLSIFEGETVNDSIIRTYEDYDHRLRPWYIPVAENRVEQWTDLYISFDNSIYATKISSVLPVIDKTGRFYGVSSVDITLDGLNDFLQSDEEISAGYVYIVNDDWQVIAHSFDVPIFNADDTLLTDIDHLNAFNSDNPLIVETATRLEDFTLMEDKSTEFTIDGIRYYAMISLLDEPLDIHWHVITLMPETVIMGDVKTRQMRTIGLMLVVFVILTGLGIYSMNRITKPILDTAKRADLMTLSTWDAMVDFEEHPLPFYELEMLDIGFKTMISRLHDSVEKIQYNEKRYRNLVENLENFIFTIEPDGTFASVNSSFENFVGESRHQLTGSHYTHFFDEKESIFWNYMLTEIMTKRRILNVQQAFNNSEGQEVFLKITMVPVFDEDDEIIQILCSCTDITELFMAQEEIASLHEKEKERLELLVKERTEKLSMAMNELVEKEKMASLGSLVSGISHEINTPLGVAVSAGSFVQSQLDHLELKISENTMSRDDFVGFLNRFSESTGIINKNLLRAADLVKSFKEIAVKQSVEVVQKFNLEHYIQSTVTSLKHEYKNIVSDISIDCDPTLEIRSYPGAFSQILTNLIMNSLIHGFGAEVSDGTIKIEVENHETDIVVRYEDSGKGIQEDIISRIFEPFFTTNRSNGGSGLGLNIVYNLVTSQLNGKIICESEIDKWTRFTITLPKSIETDGDET